MLGWSRQQKGKNMFTEKEPFEIVSVLLNPEGDDARNELVAELSQMAGEHREKVQEVLVSIYQRHRALVSDTERLSNERRRAYNTVSAQRAMNQRDRNYLHSLVSDLPNAEPIDFDGDLASHWYGVIARAGILAGYATDVQRLLEDIALNQGYASAKTAWQTADEKLTTDGEYPVPVSIEEAVAGAQEHAFHRGHPMHPQFHKFWAMVWTVAKSDTSLCEVFDEMAKALGLSEDLRPLLTSWFIVSGTFSARVEAEHYAGETPDFDMEEVYREIDRYDLDITDIEEDY